MRRKRITRRSATLGGTWVYSNFGGNKQKQMAESLVGEGSARKTSGMDEW